MFAYFRPLLTWRELARRTIADMLEDDCPGLAAQLAFYFLLAVFPTLLFVVSLLGYLPLNATLGAAVAQLEAVVPQPYTRSPKASSTGRAGGTDLHP